MRPLLSASLLLALAGCASVGTFVNQTGDLTSGRTAASVDNAQARQDAARAENMSLTQQLAGLRAQQSQLHAQLAIAQGRLHAVKLKLARDRAATQDQRDEYLRLLAKQKDLQQRLTAAAHAPPATNTEDAADQKEDLDKLAEEKAALEKQVSALQHAL